MSFFVLIVFLFQLCYSQTIENPNTTCLCEQEKDAFMNYLGLRDIYVINLDRHSERFKYIESQLDILNLPFKRFSAIDGRKIKKSIYENAETDLVLHPETLVRFDWIDKGLLTISKKHSSSSFYLIGKWQSHLQVYFQIRDTTLETGIDGPVLIFEDNIIMERSLPYAIKDYLELLPTC